MPKIAQSFSVGDRENLTINDLADAIERMYLELADAINKKADIYIRDTDGQVSDNRLSSGSININSSTGKVEILTEYTDPESVVWQTLS